MSEPTAIQPVGKAFARIEHEFGVLPLLERFFDPGLREEIVADGKVGSLGLFTPTPELGWAEAALEGKASGAAVILTGEFRLACAETDGAVVLVRLAGAPFRLAWLVRRTPGVGRRENRPEGVSWLFAEEVSVGPERLSRPVDPAPGTELFGVLADYASRWALAASSSALEGVRALRRAVRLTTHGAKNFSGAQSVAFGLAEIEIEAELAQIAARRHHRLLPAEGGCREDLAVAVAAADVLAQVAKRTLELHFELGVETEGPLAAAAGVLPVLAASLGGASMLEAELSRAIGIGDTSVREEHV